MQLTETVKLYPNKYQTELIKATMSEYISTVNHLVLDAINGRATVSYTHLIIQDLEFTWYVLEATKKVNIHDEAHDFFKALESGNM